MIRILLLVAAMTTGCNILITLDPHLHPTLQGLPGGACTDVLTQGEVPTAHLVVLIRMTPATAGLAEAYARSVSTVRLAMAQKGILVTHTLVGSLVPEPFIPNVFYDELCPNESPSSLEDTLRYYSRAMGAENRTGCEHTVLASIGDMLGNYAYPVVPRDDGGVMDVPDQLVVLYLDAASRDHTLDACSVYGQGVVDYFTATGSTATPREDGADSLLWAVYGETRLNPGQVIHLAEVTSESNESFAALSERCRGLSDFPSEVVDFMTPSANAYFSTFVDGLNAVYPSQAATLDLCDVIADLKGELVFQTLAELAP